MLENTILGHYRCKNYVEIFAALFVSMHGLAVFMHWLCPR